MMTEWERAELRALWAGLKRLGRGLWRVGLLLVVGSAVVAGVATVIEDHAIEMFVVSAIAAILMFAWIAGEEKNLFKSKEDK